MMDGWYGGMGAGWWVVMTLLWVALIVAIVWAAARLFPRRADGGRGEPDRPEEILDRRLARGEIDVETYEALRGKLRGARAEGR